MMIKIIRGCKGFTLTEVMIVVGVMAALAIISAPRILDWLPNYKLRSAVGDLSSNMRWTKLSAAKNNQQWGIQFDTVNNRYQIMDGGADGQCGTADDVTVKTISLDSYGGDVGFGFGEAAGAVNGIDGEAMPGNTVTFTANLAVFTARGMANQAGAVYLTNRNNTAYGIGNNNSAYVFMRRWTGGGWE